MSKDDSINVFDDIQSLCKDFRRQLKQGERKRIEDFLGSVGDSSKEMLFQNLLLIDVEFRRRQKKNPSSDEYVARFPQFGRLIRQVFYESTMMSQEYLGDTPDSAEPNVTLVLDTPAASRLGPYELLRELGRGGFGVVYEARHMQRNDLVALKTLPTGLDGKSGSAGDAERLHKFRNEFRSLSNVSHPNLVGMQSLEVEFDQWFLTMDLVEGDDFIGYVRPGGALDEDRLRAVLPQLVSGIMALHAQHIVHRDVKPSNVMVTTEGRVRILDFGLVAESEQAALGSTTDLSRNFAGTPAYAAPEQMSGRRSPASDWYAVGVMLYESLTGKQPFTGTAIEILTKKGMEDPPTLIGQEGIPADLAELSMQLLARQPEERPSSLQIAGMISANLPISTSSESGEQLLVGRDTHLQSMQQAYDAFVSEKIATSLFVEGRSGEGKTTLVEHFLNSLRRSTNAVVLSGRCYDRESVPLKALDCLIDPLCNWLRSQKDDASAYLPDDIHMLAHLFPVMRRVDVVATAATRPVGRIDMKQVRQRAFVALREMLHRMSQKRPVLLFIDDLQWGDADSAGAIFELFKPPNPPSVMLLGTYRSDEADEAPFLQSWRERRGGKIADHLVTLGPLSLEECVELVVARLGEDSESIRQRAAAIFEATGGSPYFLDQLIECLDADVDTFHVTPLQEIIDRKLKQLPESASRLLELVALSGHAVSLPEVIQAAGEDETVVSTLTHMRSKRLVRLIDSSDQQLVDTYHDKIRETTIERLPPELKKALHQTLGETIERLEEVTADSVLDAIADSPRIDDLAYHFDEADDSNRALSYSLGAAETARSQFALEIALGQYAKTLRYQASDNQALGFRITAGYGETLLLAGRYADADEQLNAASQLTSDSFQDARCQASRAEIAYKSKSLTESIEAYEQVLRRLGVGVPQSSIGVCAELLYYSAVYFLQRVTPATVRSKEWSPDDDTLLTLELLQGINPPTYFRCSTARSLWVSLAPIVRSQRFSRLCLPHAQFGGGGAWPPAWAFTHWESLT